MHMDSLAGTINQSTLLEALGKLPNDMSDAYDKTLTRVDNQSPLRKELAYRIFGWLTFADRPMPVWELQKALATEPGTTEPIHANTIQTDILASVCAGLVVFDGWIVRFVRE